MRLAPVFGILTVSWLLMIGEAYVFFELILPYVPPIRVLGAFTALALLKIGMTLGLCVVWFIIMSAVTSYYASSKVRRQTPNPSS